MQDGERIRGIFWLDNPKLYYAALNCLMMLISLYMSLWFVNFDRSVRSVSDGDFWKVRLRDTGE
jgi:hypothetical protein